MNNEYCWYNLNLDITGALRSDFSLDEPSWTVKRCPHATDLFNQSWLDYMTDLGLTVTNTMVFYRLPSDKIEEAHSDIYFESDGTMVYRSFAINWAIGGEDSEMEWYRQTDQPVDLELTMANTHFFSWPIEQLTKIDQVAITNVPTVVRVDLPHRIVVRDRPRIGISVRTRPFNNKWSNIVAYLRFKKILIERK